MSPRDIFESIVLIDELIEEETYYKLRSTLFDCHLVSRRTFTFFNRTHERVKDILVKGGFVKVSYTQSKDGYKNLIDVKDVLYQQCDYCGKCVESGDAQQICSCDGSGYGGLLCTLVHAKDKKINSGKYRVLIFSPETDTPEPEIVVNVFDSDFLYTQSMQLVPGSRYKVYGFEKNDYAKLFKIVEAE